MSSGTTGGSAATPNSIEYLELGDDLDPEEVSSTGSITTIDMTDDEMAEALKREQTRPLFGFQGGL